MPELTEAQQKAREEWMLYWHQTLPKGFSMVENFNHGFPAKLNLPSEKKIRTLDVGAGLGEHAEWEDLNRQEYYLLEFREDWVNKIRERYPTLQAIHADMQKRIPFHDHFFDRVISIHVFEHLPDLPKALTEIKRVLTPGGSLDVVLPCEGGIAYEVARKISSDRMFRKKFGMPYKPIMAYEHINTYPEVLEELQKSGFKLKKKRMFPLPFAPYWQFNLCVGLRFEA